VRIKRHRRHDVMGTGGNIASGYRIVRKGGRVKFDNFWHSHPKLEHLVGHEVWVHAENAFYSEKVSIHHDTLSFICNAPNEYNEERQRRLLAEELQRRRDEGEE